MQDKVLLTKATLSAIFGHKGIHSLWVAAHRDIVIAPHVCTAGYYISRCISVYSIQSINERFCSCGIPLITAMPAMIKSLLDIRKSLARMHTVVVLLMIEKAALRLRQQHHSWMQRQRRRTSRWA